LNKSKFRIVKGILSGKAIAAHPSDALSLSLMTEYCVIFFAAIISNDVNVGMPFAAKVTTCILWNGCIVFLVYFMSQQLIIHTAVTPTVLIT